MNKRKNKQHLKPELLYRYFVFVGVVVLVFIVFGQSLSFGFVRDDTYHLYKNPWLQQVTLNNLAAIWSNVYWRLYIPVTYTIWALLKPLGAFIFDTGQAFEPGIYHFINIFFHGLNTFLVYCILTYLSNNKKAAILAALVFALHPLQVETVVWVSELRGLLSTFFGLLLCLNYFRFREVAQRSILSYHIRQSVLLLLSVLSKPTGVVFPIIIMVCEIMLYRQKILLVFKQYAYLLVLVIPQMLVTYKVQPGAEQQQLINNLWLRPFVWSDAFCFYMFKSILPFNLATSYNRTTDMLMDYWWFYASIIIPIILVIWFWRQYKAGNQLFFFAVVVFIIGFLPVSGIVGHAYQSWSNVADRFIYPSLSGLAIFVLAFLQTKPLKKWRYVMVILLCLMYGVINYTIQIPVWSSGVSLWTHTINVTHNNSRAYLCRADILVKQNKYNQSINDYNKALGILPGYEGYNSRGIAYYKLHEYEKALADFNTSIALNTRYTNAFNNRGNVFLALGRYKLALADYEKAQQLSPDDYRTYLNEANAETLQKNWKEALELYNTAEDMGAKVPALYQGRAKVLLQLSQYNAAESDLLNYIRLSPGSPEGYLQLAHVYFINKQYEKAIQPISRYLMLNPTDGDAYYNRSKMYFFGREYKKALSDLKKASELGVFIEPAFYKALNQK